MSGSRGRNGAQWRVSGVKWRKSAALAGRLQELGVGLRIAAKQRAQDRIRTGDLTQTESSVSANVPKGCERQSRARRAVAH